MILSLCRVASSRLVSASRLWHNHQRPTGIPATATSLLYSPVLDPDRHTGGGEAAFGKPGPIFIDSWSEERTLRRQRMLPDDVITDCVCQLGVPAAFPGPSRSHFDLAGRCRRVFITGARLGHLALRLPYLSSLSSRPTIPSALQPPC